MKGTLYGVSVGPGDPELMTLQAVRLLKHCPIIAVPQTAGGGTVALDIASQVVDLSGKEMIMLPFLMVRDRQKLQESHRQLAGLIRTALEQGRDVAMLSLGDASVYSSFSYMAELLKPEGYPIVVSAGVTSFCASAAALGVSLTQMNQPVHIIPAGADDGQALALFGTKVLMKAGKSLPQLLSRLKERGQLDNAMLVQNCGLPNEKILKTIPADFDAPGYFTTVIVKE
ncbi:precorrin-2 C(20)-methyltransferase [Oscillospiraceae bacterium LTW-04]|nr:precorrin-2 C(20)-methyltransferase [Oscillospiraceae bacterium MB24-C1]